MGGAYPEELGEIILLGVQAFYGFSSTEYCDLLPSISVSSAVIYPLRYIHFATIAQHISSIAIFMLRVIVDPKSHSLEDEETCWLSNSEIVRDCAMCYKKI